MEDKNKEIKILKQTIVDLENKWLNSEKRCEALWNKALEAAMSQFGSEHKPRCKKTFCLSCHARELVAPLIRDVYGNRKSSREFAIEFIEMTKASKAFHGYPEERKTYLGAIKAFLDYLINKGVM
jgi:hypothetical protein